MTPGDETVQILTPEGEVKPTKAAEPFLEQLELLSTEDYLRAYRDMSYVRAADREPTMLPRQGQLSLYVPAEGQEAAQIGSAYAMRPQDAVFPSYREHGVAFVRGVDLVDVLRLLRGVTHSGWSPEGHGVRPYTLVIGSQTLHATGYALGQKFDGATGTGDLDKDEATVVYFGDGATSQGDTNEAYIFATSYQVPLVFFLQNNQWAISVPVSVQANNPLYKRAGGFGMPSTHIDGNDVMASFAVTRSHLERARAGGGPGFIEAETYRMGAHTTTDDPTKYRTKDEEESWRRRDPIARLAKYLRGQDVGDDFFAGVDEAAKDYAADVRRGVFEIEEPDNDSMFDNVYSDAHPQLEDEKQWLRRYEASFDEAANQEATR